MAETPHALRFAARTLWLFSTRAQAFANWERLCCGIKKTVPEQIAVFALTSFFHIFIGTMFKDFLSLVRFTSLETNFTCTAREASISQFTG
jgi:hypothetical protein